ncbi:hypothetical protein [Microbulbifer sp. VAAF005]|uniref:hypothetical protein n=1 Tax=Microbulbifer sp. VAAF005 TaxID=3034230 RepID=UPI0024ACFEA1|nr:hypothetical protein [Microbulbifer sp. VAAF005]WHI45606.1 hypothetical protein P0078_18010 [Microbulbifer sp. VAAF005]
MKKFLSIIALAIATTSCMKLEVQPGNVIGDTVDAGKDAFQSIKRSRNGEEERDFSHKISYDPAISNAVNITNCKKEMMEVISASELSVSQILTESSEVIGEEGSKSVQCTAKVVVTKNI